MKVFLLFAVFVIISSSCVALNETTMGDIQEALNNLSSQLEKHNSDLEKINQQGERMQEQREETVFLMTDSNVRMSEGITATSDVNNTVIEEDGKRYVLKLHAQEAIAKASGKFEDAELAIENDKLVYKIKTYQQRKLLWIKMIDIPVVTTVDAETGAVSEKLPWYSFVLSKA